MRRVLPLLLAIAAFAAVGVVWIVTDRRASQRVYDRFSSANTSGEGLSQAAGYLARRGKSAMLTLPVGRAAIEADAVVFRLADELPLYFDPEDLDEGEFGPPRPKERPLLNDDEDAFVRRGGRFVIGAHAGALPAGTPASRRAGKVFPIWPGVDALAAGKDSSGFTTIRPRMHALFVAGDKVVVARERIGDGDLYVVSWPDIFTNDHLSREDHLALLSALAGKRPVYFDEVLHGIRSDDGALALMADWNLGPFLMLLCGVATLWFWRASKRIGPPEDEYRETRSDAVDLVRSLAALYKQVTPEEEALALYHDSLTRTVAHTTGLRGDALRARVEGLTGGRRTMPAINDGFLKLQSASRRGAESSTRTPKTGRLGDSNTRTLVEK